MSENKYSESETDIVCMDLTQEDLNLQADSYLDGQEKPTETHH